MRFTLFPSKAARTKTDHDEPWSAICDGIARAPEYAGKLACPWISLARYGDAVNENQCLRYAENVLAITGLEGDYDAERVSIDDAANMARAAGLSACLYTSASHTPDAPRWRILVPLSCEHPLSERAALMDRLNGAMGGILAGESWTNSQAFLVGRVAGVEYRCIVV